MPDEKILSRLCAHRQGRRFAYCPEALWRAILAKEFLGHQTVAALVRELLRNAELREACGFEKVQDVPTQDYVWSRFIARLEKHEAVVREMFDTLLGRLSALLPKLGRRLAVDSKALPVEGARPADADTGMKTYEQEGTKKTLSWFGYKVHVLADAIYELPLGYIVTKASDADSNQLLPLVEALAADHSEVAQRGETLAADRAYDERDRRLLTPHYFHSRNFNDLYKDRTSIERLFNRVDHVHGLERSHVRTLGRMQVRVGLVFLIMLAQAVAAVQAGHPEAVRRILRHAA